MLFFFRVAALRTFFLKHYSDSFARRVVHRMGRVFLGRATPPSAGGRHSWLVDCVGPKAPRRSSHARSIYRLLCVHHHFARGIKAVVVFRC